MLISSKLNAAINVQIGRELLASHQYTNMATYFEDRALKKLAEMFYAQGQEERDHAMKFIRYVASVNGKVEIPTVEAPKADFDSVEEAVQLALNGELDITRRINELMDMAIAENDHATRAFLTWFVTEQIEEVATMENMLKVVQMSGERNIIMVEAYLVHGDL